MAVHLRRAARIELPPAFWMWGLFLAWQLLGLTMLDRSPPGTHPGSESGRIVSLSYTIVIYAAITITLLYVGNLSVKQVPQTAIARWLGGFFLTLCAGGFLGTFAPKFSFKSAIEFVMPHRLAADGFVKSLVHPVAAQVQDVIGEGNARPAAPFGYTNSWGNALSLLLVWFVAAWVLPAKGARRVLYAGIVVISAVPIVYSLNRGLWIGLGATVVWVLARQLSQGRVGRVLGVVGAAAIAAVAIAASPLASIVSARLTHGVSNNIRAFVDHLSWVAIQHSPIIGYGGNRHANGSSGSIAVGPTPGCPTCGGAATGSTGQLWSLLFNNGVVGTLLYFGFFAVILWVYRRRRGAIYEAALITIALGYIYMFFYNALPVAPTVTMIAVGVLWRGTGERAETEPAGAD
jgi:O-antigen ligase